MRPWAGNSPRSGCLRANPTRWIGPCDATRAWSAGYDDLLQEAAGRRAPGRGADSRCHARRDRPGSARGASPGERGRARSWARPLLRRDALGRAVRHAPAGLVVVGGSADRFELPVEVELTLARGSGRKAGARLPAHAERRPPRKSWPSSIAGSSARQAAAWSWFCPARSRRDRRRWSTFTWAWPKRPEPLPQAVSTRTRPQRHAVDRKQQGPPAARARKAATSIAGRSRVPAGSDLTQPGETGWAGFCDMGTHRAAPYRLECAAAGPALVRYQCTDPSGHTKTISLYRRRQLDRGRPERADLGLLEFRRPAKLRRGRTPPRHLSVLQRRHRSSRPQADGVPAQVKAP